MESRSQAPLTDGAVKDPIFAKACFQLGCEEDSAAAGAAERAAADAADAEDVTEDDASLRVRVAVAAFGARTVLAFNADGDVAEDDTDDDGMDEVGLYALAVKGRVRDDFTRETLLFCLGLIKCLVSASITSWCVM